MPHLGVSVERSDACREERPVRHVPECSGESASTTKTIDASPSSIATTRAFRRWRRAIPFIASALAGVPRGTRNGDRRQLSRCLVPVASAERELGLGARGEAELDDGPQEMETLGDVRRQLDALGVGGRERLPVEGHGHRSREVRPPAPSHTRRATRPFPPLPGRSASTASTSGLGTFNVWRARADLDAPGVARDRVEVMRRRSRAEVHHERPRGFPRERDPLPVEQDLDCRRSGRGAELDLPGPPDDSEEERQERQHPGHDGAPVPLFQGRGCIRSAAGIAYVFAGPGTWIRP